MRPTHRALSFVTLACVTAYVGCGGSNANTDPADAAVASSNGLDPKNFIASALTGDITEVECTLSNGVATTCYRIPIAGKPADHPVGPFCPRNIADGPEQAGIWIESGNAYDADGAFIKNLATFYNDAKWQLYDEATGAIRVTDTQAACEAAARPDVDPAYQNHCVECSLDYVNGGIAAEILIPIHPVVRATPVEIGGASKVGVALNGAHFDPPAPVQAILAAYTIAAFDDCGGHVNPHVGYHYHAATGCSAEVKQADGHAPLIGYALDGFAMHAMAGEDGVEPKDLDTCRGHTDDERGYHYHVASAGENMFIGCFRGEIVGTATGAGPGGAVTACADVPAGSPCCGDGTCDGPETTANCASDCQ